TATRAAPSSSRSEKMLPDTTGHSRTAKNDGGAPCTAVDQFLSPLTICAIWRLKYETSFTAGHSFLIAIASATVSVDTPPAPDRTPLEVVAPGTIMSRSVPRLRICSC